MTGDQIKRMLEGLPAGPAKDGTGSLLKIAGALNQLKLAEESTSDEVTRRHLREIISWLSAEEAAPHTPAAVDPAQHTREQIFHICFERASPNLTEDAVERQSDRITDAVMALLSASRIPAEVESVADDDDQMVKISKLIADLQSIMARFGDTCVYIRRGGLSWGAVALNRRDDDQKHGVFDLQAQHDRDMLQRAEQVERLIKARNEAEQKLAQALSQVESARVSGIEEAAKFLDEAAQDWRRIRDPGMANNAAAYAKKIRALAGKMPPDGLSLAHSSTIRAPEPLMEANQAQHDWRDDKKKPARFTRNGKLETCQCRDCRSLSPQMCRPEVES